MNPRRRRLARQRKKDRRYPGRRSMRRYSSVTFVIDGVEVKNVETINYDPHAERHSLTRQDFDRWIVRNLIPNARNLP